MEVHVYRSDFNYIKKFVEAGNSVNQLDKDGSSLFTSFLNEYYENLIDEEEANERIILVGEYDKRGSLSKYQMLDLPERTDGILDRLNWFIENGVDFNLVDAENEDCETPLTIALWYEDYYMMKFLLEHGANPKTWYTPASERFGNPEFELELMETLDCYMDDTCGNRFRNQKRLVWLLMDYGLPVTGVFRFIFEAEDEYKAWHKTVDGKNPKTMSQDEVFDILCTLSETDVVDIDCIRNYLECFKPNEKNCYEKLFSQAFFGRNVELFKMLYEYCPNPDYASEYMSVDILFNSQYIDDIPAGRWIEELDEKEEADAIEGGICKIQMIHYMFSHPDAVKEYKNKTGIEESMMHHITYELGEKWCELSIMQLKKVFIELTAYHVFDDFGPTILKEFDLDRLDDYRMIVQPTKDTWKIYDYNDVLVAEF